MKGIVFREFIDMVEASFGDEMVDTIIEACDLESGGAYTAVGTYDHTELVQMVVALSGETGAPVPALVEAFGTYLLVDFSNSSLCSSITTRLLSFSTPSTMSFTSRC